jgi:hypothetical protein
MQLLKISSTLILALAASLSYSLPSIRSTDQAYRDGDFAMW